MATTTHWKKLHNPMYLGAYSIETPNLVVTIKSVGKEEIVGDGGKKDEVIVAQLVNQKPMVLNATNCKIIAKMYTPYIENWIGKKITLYVAQVKIAGEYVDALRVQPAIPKEGLPELTPSHPKWEDAKKGIKDSGYTIADIRTKYTLSDANAKLLEQ